MIPPASRTALLFTVGGTAAIVWGALISLQPPFYPTLAEIKGATPSQYGLVFGITNLAALVSAPMFGAHGNKIGAKYIYNIGSFVQALCAISFGFLMYVDNLGLFLGLSYFLRTVDGIADAAAFCSMTSILLVLYPDNVGTVMATSETVWGVGYAMGPAIGSMIYSIGGFGAPFWTVGTVGFVCAVVMFFLLQPVTLNTANKSLDNKNKKCLTLKDVLSSFEILLPLYDTFLIVNGFGILESMLGQHITEFARATQGQVSWAFLLLGGSYLVTSMIAGFICDRHPRYPLIVSIIGLASMGTAYLFVGPVTFLDTPLTIPVIYGMTTLAGLGMGSVVVSTFSRFQLALLSNGFKDDLQTYLLMSGMWTSMYYLGNFVGPTFGGILVDYYGFRATTVVVFCSYCLSMAVDLIDLFFKISSELKVQKKPQMLKYQPLKQDEETHPSQHLCYYNEP